MVANTLILPTFLGCSYLHGSWGKHEWTEMSWHLAKDHQKSRGCVSWKRFAAGSSVLPQNMAWPGQWHQASRSWPFWFSLAEKPTACNQEKAFMEIGDFPVRMMNEQDEELMSGRTTKKSSKKTRKQRKRERAAADAAAEEAPLQAAAHAVFIADDPYGDNGFLLYRYFYLSAVLAAAPQGVLARHVIRHSCVCVESKWQCSILYGRGWKIHMATPRNLQC